MVICSKATMEKMDKELELTEKAVSVISAYITYSKLYDNGNYQGPYQIIGEFIKHAIASDNLHYFTEVKMRTVLSNNYGFSLPLAVVSRALRHVEGISTDGMRGNWQVIDPDLYNEDLHGEFNEVEEKSLDIVNQIVKYISDREERELSRTEQQNIQQEIIEYLLDENGQNQYKESISEFFLLHQDSESIKQVCKQIREGAILYRGLACDMVEVGSITQDITLYLDVEILFDLAGLNGDIYQKLSQEFYDQVKAANEKGKKHHVKITLKYFEETENRINNYFYAAENSLKYHYPLNYTAALKWIMNGCKSPSDVLLKKNSFFHCINYTYGIKKESNQDFYSTENYSYNLEGIDSTKVLGKLGLLKEGSDTIVTDDVLVNEELDDADNFDRKSELTENNEQDIKQIVQNKGYTKEKLIQIADNSIKYIDHINKIRKGQTFNDYFIAKAIFVTGSHLTHRISHLLLTKGKSDSNNNIAEYAVSMSYLTQLLWLKLNRGFTPVNLPLNVDITIKAKLVLAGMVKAGVNEAYREYTKQYLEGKISSEEWADTLLEIRKKPTIPDEITNENVEEALNFNEDYILSRANSIEAIKEDAKIQLAFKDKELEQKQSEINALQEMHRISESDSIEKDKQIEADKEVISNQQKELEKYKRKNIERKEKEKAEQLKKTKRKNIIITVISVVIVIIVGVLISNLLKEYCPSFYKKYVFIVNIISLIFTFGIPAAIYTIIAKANQSKQERD